MKWLSQVLEPDGSGAGTRAQDSLSAHHPVQVPHPQLVGRRVGRVSQLSLLSEDGSDEGG